MRQERRADIRADLQERQAHTDRLMAMSGQPVQQEICWFCWSWVRFLSLFLTFETMKKASLKHIGNLVDLYIIYICLFIYYLFIYDNMIWVKILSDYDINFDMKF